MSSYYRQRFDGEWTDVSFGVIRACCDCGLCHKEEYKIIEGENKDKRIIRRAFRLNRDTADRRRSMKSKKEGLFKNG